MARERLAPALPMGRTPKDCPEIRIDYKKAQVHLNATASQLIAGAKKVFIDTDKDKDKVWFIPDASGDVALVTGVRQTSMRISSVTLIRRMEIKRDFRASCELDADGCLHFVIPPSALVEKEETSE